VSAGLLRIRPPATLTGMACARADGITGCNAPRTNFGSDGGPNLDHRGDLSGGGFLIRAADGACSAAACGPPSVVEP